MTVVGCGNYDVVMSEDGDDVTLKVVLVEPPIVITGSLANTEALAREAMRKHEYEKAGDLYLSLSVVDTDSNRRSEFLFLSAECALGEGDHHKAYRRYSALLKTYPLTDRFSTVVERVFTVARLYCEGRADRPSWLFGISLADRQFGIDILTEFQKAREQHPLADDALHHKASALFDMKEFQLAIGTWTKLEREYSESEWAPTANYRIGLALLELSDGVDYDKAPLRAGLNHLRQYLKVHAAGDHRVEAKAKVEELEEALAGQLLVTAEFYLGKDQNYSASLYLEAIDRDYPGTAAAKEARSLNATIPKSSPPPARPDPEELEGPLAVDVDRFRKPPPESAGLNPKPSD